MAEDNRGNFGDPEEHKRAGQMGGEATSDTHDKGFYEDIGSEGGKASSGNTSSDTDSSSTDNPGQFQEGSERAREEGSKGGSS